MLVGEVGKVGIDGEEKADDEDLNHILANVHTVDDTATLQAHADLIPLSTTGDGFSTCFGISHVLEAKSKYPYISYF